MTAPSLADLGFDQAPPPIEQVRGADYPLLKDQDSKKKVYLQTLLSKAKPLADALMKQASKHKHYADGRMWLDWNRTRGEWGDRPLEEEEIRVSINHIRPILRSKTQRLLSSRIDFVVIPSSNDFTERDRCRLGTSFLASRFDLLKMNQKLDAALEDAQYAGFSVFKTFWNPKIGPLEPAVLKVPKTEPVVDGFGQPAMDELGQPMTRETGEFEDVPVGLEEGTGNIIPVEDPASAYLYHLGDTDVAIRNVFNLCWNPEAKGWSPAEGMRWVIDREWLELPVAKEKFPHIAAQIAAAGLEPQNQSLEQRYNVSGITPSGITPVTTSNSRDPKVQVVEYWELESAYFPKGRMITMVGDACAYDGPFPDDIFPYDPVFDEPSPGIPAGRSCLTDMIDPSDVINRQWTAIVQEMWDQGTGQFVAWDLAGIPDQLSRESRQIIKIPMRSNAQGRGIRDFFTRIEAASVPPERWRLIEAAERTLFDVGSYHEVTRGQVPPGIESGAAIEKLQEQERGQLQKAVLALENTIISVARKQLQIARKRYKDVKRWVPVKRDDLGYMVEGVDGPNLPDPQTVQIALDRFRPHSQSAHQANIKELMASKSIPPELGLKLLDLGRGLDAAFSSQTRHYSKARWENIQMQKGIAKFVPLGVNLETGQEVLGLATPPDMPLEGDPNSDPTEPPEGVEMVPCLLWQDDDHAIHMEVCDELALDVTQPWSLRQLVIAHKDEHRQAIQRQQMMAQQAMMAAAMMNQPPDKKEGGSDDGA